MEVGRCRQQKRKLRPKALGRIAGMCGCALPVGQESQ
uniref:Uncharacterized protein n=1 Tax=Siphoviridae sp. ctrCN24 TaxID=2827953 RepID=A0A8S5SLH3_9CAUD|nr:MAG TPA: hypothetical protein [Siphoviridae sp. ctrCN24]